MEIKTIGAVLLSPSGVIEHVAGRLRSYHSELSRRYNPEPPKAPDDTVREARLVRADFLATLERNGEAELPLMWAPMLGRQVTGFGFRLPDGRASVLILDALIVNPLAAAAEEVLAQMRANELVRQRVLRYLPKRAQRRVAARIAQAVSLKLLRYVATDTEVQDADQVGLSLPDQGTIFPAGVGRHGWCPGCEDERPIYYRATADRCIKCGTPVRQRLPRGP